MSIEKLPLDEKQLAAFTDAAMKHSDGEIALIMRFTGMHPAVMIDPARNLREETDDKDRALISWDRPKKEGKDAFTSIMKSKNLNVDVNKFVADFQNRRRKKSRQYIHTLINKIGLAAGIPGVSPMTLRHSLCVELLNRGIPEVTVRQILNVSPKTMERYAKYTNRGKADLLERIGW